MSVTILADANVVLDRNVHRAVDDAVRSCEIEPALRRGYAARLLALLREGVQESEELRRIRLVEQGAPLAATYARLIRERPDAHGEIADLEATLDKLVAEIRALPSGPGYRPGGSAA